MSKENQPNHPIERMAQNNFIEQFYRQPNIGESIEPNIVDKNTRGINPAPLYECNLCSKKYERYQNLIKHRQSHNNIDFVCTICNRRFQLPEKDMDRHFKAHENLILQQTNFVKKVENPLFSLYEKNFDDDEWRVNPFLGETLDDITKVVKICSFMKKRFILNISCKLWFIAKPALEAQNVHFVWSSLPNIQIEWTDLNIKRKIFKHGQAFLSNFLETDSIEEHGSGFVYYAISDISIKCTKNTKIGCYLDIIKHKFKSQLEICQRKQIIYNPVCKSFCLLECIKHYSIITKVKLDTSCDIFKRPQVSLLDLENWNEEGLDFGLRIVVFNEKDGSTLYPIFVSTTYHDQIHKVDLLVIMNTDESAHFVLILDINSMLKVLKKSNNPSKSKKTDYFCKFCLQKNTYFPAVLAQHERYCLNNPNSSHHQDILDLKDLIEFEDKKTYLRCNDDGKTPPNWIGFVDFETVASTLELGDTDVCKKHKLLGLSQCKCAMSFSGDSLKSLSYSLIILDFNTDELIYEIFYIQKHDFQLTASAHFVDTLKKLGQAFQIINQINHPIEMTKEERMLHEKATHCQRCGRKFNKVINSKNVFKNIDNAYLGYAKTLATAPVTKTAHHLHHLKEQNFSATLCSRCNLSIQSKRQNIPIFCHNFSRFDHVLVLKDFYRAWDGVVDIISKSENNIMCIKAYPFHLKDSLNFLSGSLDENVKLVKQSCIKSCERCESKEKLCKQCKLRTRHSLSKTFSTIHQSDLSKVEGEMDFERFERNLKKSVFPYSILTTYAELKMMKNFPSRDKFYSALKDEEVKEEDYHTAKRYFESYCENMYDFLKVYNSLDTHLLYSVWKVMSSILIREFKHYPEKYFSLPSLSYSIAKSFIPHPSLPGRTCIEMFSKDNSDIYLKCMENIRGGVVMVNSRFELDTRFKTLLSREIQCKSQITNLQDKQEIMLVDDTTTSEELLYLDANNLYGYCLSSRLPCGNYSPLSDMFIANLNKVLKRADIVQRNKIINDILPDDFVQGYAFQIRILHIPQKLHEFPPFFKQQYVKAMNISETDQAAYKGMVGKNYSGNKNKKLLPLLEEKGVTFCHYKLMKEAIKQGVSLEIISGISFRQIYLFKEYISILAKLRANTNNPAYSRVLKLLSNALFGKLLQSIVKYNKKYTLFYVKNWKQFDFSKINDLIQEIHRNSKKKHFKDIKIYDEDFFAIETEFSPLKAVNCPLIAFSILELAKARNFEFFWRMKEASPETKLLYCDTDSFILKCSKVWYEEVRAIKDEFDFSKSSPKFSYLMRLSAEDKEKYRGVVGKYKSEIKQESVLIGYVALQKKCYCLLLLNKFKCSLCQNYSMHCSCKNNYQGKDLYYITFNPTAKGKEVKKLSFANYVKCLSENQWECESRYVIRQKRKQLAFSFLKYKSLTNFDDSNFTLDCNIHNVPFSHSNHLLSNCKEESCKDSFNYINFLHTNLDQFKDRLFYFENDELITFEKCETNL